MLDVTVQTIRLFLPRGRAIWGALAALSAVAALFLGVLLHG